ncbi:unnamed protein product, partial [Polarella glacialis]
AEVWEELGIESDHLKRAKMALLLGRGLLTKTVEEETVEEMLSEVEEQGLAAGDMPPVEHLRDRLRNFKTSSDGKDEEELGANPREGKRTSLGSSAGQEPGQESLQSSRRTSIVKPAPLGIWQRLSAKSGAVGRLAKGGLAGLLGGAAVEQSVVLEEDEDGFRSDED